jgi:hypothetical protein
MSPPSPKRSVEALLVQRDVVVSRNEDLVCKWRFLEPIDNLWRLFLYRQTARLFAIEQAQWVSGDSVFAILAEVAPFAPIVAYEFGNVAFALFPGANAVDFNYPFVSLTTIVESMFPFIP